MATKSLIPVVGKLHDVFATIGNRENEIQLPQIVVVGSQSSGKSSVIEGLVGRDFLPRGNGIVTRRPLLIHLTPMPINDPKRLQDPRCKTGDWATFEHLQHEIFTDFQKVREAIESETIRETGTNKGISNIPISLKIYSANVVDLTLIDLPGITRNPVGDQPSNIEALIREMIMEYISNPNSIILAVTPANVDFATSDSLKLARDVDPNGDRTLCVLTKLDLMDRGTDAMDVLMGKQIPVKLGIVGVVNRSQADINAKKPMEECLKDEVTFLRRKYPAIASKNGIRFLEKSLNSLLLNHIRKNLPEVALRIAKLKSEYQATMLSYGEPITDKSALLLDALTSFSNNFNSLINGSVVSKSSELIGGARIREIFYDKFGASLEEINPLEGLSNEMIIGNIRNANGTKSFFVPQVSFEILVKEQMKLLDEPSLKCVDLVYEELLRMIQHCGGEIQHEMQRFPRLYERMIQILLLLPKKNDTYFKNGWFFDTPDCKEEVDYDYDERIASFVECKIRRYFDIVMKLIQDSVPKAIMKFLVHKVRDELRNELLRTLYQKNMDYLLCENEILAQQRKETSEMLDALTKADEIINGIREIYQVGDIVENGGENVTDVLQVANATDEADNVVNEIRETGNFGEYIKLLVICVCFILFFLFVKFFTL